MSSGGIQSHRFARRVFLSLILASSIFSHTPLFAAEGDADQPTRTVSGNQLNAREIWNALMGSMIGPYHLSVIVKDTEKPITSGAEKEGGSHHFSRIVRIMGPNADLFRAFGRAPQNEDFLREFLAGWTTGRYRTREDVIDQDGKLHEIDFENLQATNLYECSRSELLKLFDQWLEQTQNSPFSFLNLSTRQKIYNGTFPHLDEENRIYDQYLSWVPHLGSPQKYLTELEPQRKTTGWEIKFEPQTSMSAFEGMIDWLRKEMESPLRDENGNFISDENGELIYVLYQAPGHIRLVFPLPKGGEKADRKIQEERFSYMAEIHKTAQALILMRGLERQTGIQYSGFKWANFDAELINESGWDGQSQYGILRLEGERFGKGTISVEIRAGSKDEEVRRFIELVYLSRVGALDFNGIARADSWELVWDLQSSYTDKTLAENYAVSIEEAREVRRRLYNVQNASGTQHHQDAWIMFWDWQNAPFISEEKGSFLGNLSHDFIKAVNALPDDEEMSASIEKLARQWITGSQLVGDIAEYLRPKSKLRSDRSLQVAIPQQRGAVDVNQIPMGFEMTARFPLKTISVFEDVSYLPGYKPWAQTLIDLTPSEKQTLIGAVARSIGQMISGNQPFALTAPAQLNAHGHGIDVAYTLSGFRHDPTLNYRIEWDGIGRTYDTQGEIMDHSIRGGHVEVVTSKKTSFFREINAIFAAFRQHNLLSTHRLFGASPGGNHINVDLTLFEKNPEALARFLTLFHRHRGIISLMFQHASRIKTAEPAEVSIQLAEALAQFTGSSEELKALLYNSHYFNPRIGRKTKNTQVNLIAFFQDVLPEEYITHDYDQNGPNVFWRPQFKVDPAIRKMELRLFDSPKSEWEAAMQILFVRALLNLAFNGKAPIEAYVQPIQYEEYAAQPDRAYTDLVSLCDELDLPTDKFIGFVAEGIFATQKWVSRQSYVPAAERLSFNPRYPSWKPAVSARDPQNGIRSRDRVWDGKPTAHSRWLANSRISLNQRHRHVRNIQGNVSLQRSEVRERAERAQQRVSTRPIAPKNPCAHFFSGLRALR